MRGDKGPMKRRELLKKAGLAAGAMAIPKWTRAARAPKLDCVFQLSVITDEISQDFGHAIEVAANEFGLSNIEIRGLWKKNILGLDEKELAEAKRLVAKYDLKVTDIASPLFKVDWPGAPKSKFSPTGSAYNASFTFDQQDEVLEKSIAIAKSFGTNRVRMFDFWKLEDDKPYRDAMDAKIREFSAKAAKKNIMLDARKRIRVQHVYGVGVGTAACRGSGEKFRAQLGSGQCCRAWRSSLSGWLCKGSQGPHRARASEGCRLQKQTENSAGPRWVREKLRMSNNSKR